MYAALAEVNRTAATVVTLSARRLLRTGELYLHEWEGRLRDAVSRLEEFTLRIFPAEYGTQVPLTATRCHLPNTDDRPTARNVVPRDRIELSTPAFSGLCSAN